ncbi:APC family permease [Actinoplanes sp. TBRC 11911]|uniref:APC family permease n=1 Tax=Actinoplanes sp. TBRC 11911 TaxID=2729386 RepID=UPI00145CA08A|nr:APC family permease [Actinoplanes sp. TBRC 11911]NMO49918.1 APC family permease [Actinoplanes sp. TBRC 11911]
MALRSLPGDGDGAPESADREIPNGDPRLAHGVLSTLDVIAVSVTLIAPGMTMLLNLPGIAAVAGGSTPLAFLIGGAACLALAFVVVGFTRRMATAGYAYTYVSRTLGKSAGFVAGWLYGFCMLCAIPMAMAAAAFLLTDLLHLSTHWWFPLFVAGMALLVALSVARIRIATRLLLVVGTAVVIIILIVNIAVTAKGGAHGNTLQPFTFAHTNRGGFSGVFYGIILAVSSFLGFETAADFGEETSMPRRSVPTAVIVSVLFAIVLYLWTAYTLTIGFGVSAGTVFGADPFALKTIADEYLGHGFGTLVEVGGVLSAFFLCVGCMTAGTRTLHAMSREGALPAWLGRINSRSRTPANASVSLAAVATVLAAAVGFGLGSDNLGGQPTTVYYFFATLGTLCIVMVFIGLCVGSVIFFRRTRPRYNLFLHAVIPVIGVAIFCAALYGSVYPSPVYPINLTPYLAHIWLMIGIIVVAVLRNRRPGTVRRIGSIVGEEGPDLPRERVPWWLTR